MIADGKAMTLVANELDQVKDRRVAIEDHRLLLVAVEIDDLFLFGDRSQGLRSQAERLKGLGGGVKLAESSIHEHQRGHGLGFILKAAITPMDHLPHGSKIVYPENSHDLELAIGLLVHLAVDRKSTRL